MSDSIITYELKPKFLPDHLTLRQNIEKYLVALQMATLQ